MIRFLKAAARGVKAEIYGSGWSPLHDRNGLAGPSYGSNAGVSVSGETALKTSAAFDAVKKTADMVAGLPVDLYEKKPDGTRVKLENQLADLLKFSPNAGQTAFEFWEGQTTALLLHGNAFNERVFVGKDMVALQPLLGCKAQRRKNGGLQYVYLDRGKREVLPADKVAHFRGFGPGDGIGLSAIKYGANSLGAALAADESAGAFFSNSMTPAGVLEADQTLDANQRAQLQTMLQTYAGSKKAGKVMTLEAGLKYKQLQMSPEDAQLLDTRRFNVEDVCRWFGIPPIVIGHAAQGQTMWGSGVEAILIAWLTTGINPLLTRFEGRILKDLIPVEKRRRWYAEWNREAMIQMDSKAKGDLMLKLRIAGIMSGDEGRDRLNLPRRGGNSDRLYIQSSMTPVDALGKDET